MATIVLDISVSLDGYIATPDDRLGGQDGELLHRWFWEGGAMDRPEGLLCTIRAPLTARLGSRTN